jgi:hypothetical protein
MKTTWNYYLLMVLIIEKIIQHIVVTLAFYFNWADIASTVKTSPTFLMIAGAFIAMLFLISLWGMIKKQVRTLNLLIFLALFDTVGEFVVQGRFDIVITVSFLIAIILLILTLIFRHNLESV